MPRCSFSAVKITEDLDPVFDSISCRMSVDCMRFEMSSVDCCKGVNPIVWLTINRSTFSRYGEIIDPIGSLPFSPVRDCNNNPPVTMIIDPMSKYQRRLKASIYKNASTRDSSTTI